MARLYVGNLPWEITEADLRDAFSGYTVTDAKVLVDRETGRSRGFGFVEVKDTTAAEVIADMDGRELGGRTLKMSEANARTPPGGKPSGKRPAQANGHARVQYDAQDDHRNAWKD